MNDKYQGDHRLARAHSVEDVMRAQAISGTDAPKAKSELEDRLRTLATRRGHLQAKISELYDRLSPVLADPSANSVGSAAMAEGPIHSSKLIAELDGEADSLHSSANFIQSIIDRLVL